MNQTQIMFSNNGKVSVRQMHRLLVLEIFGISSLVLPGVLAKVCQNDGFFAILTAAILWAVLIRMILQCRYKKEKNQNCRENTGMGPQGNKYEDAKGNADKDAKGSANKDVRAEFNGDLQPGTTWVSKIRSLVFVIVFCIAGGFLLYVLSSLVENQLLETGYLWFVVLTVLFAGGYGIIRGMECRARIYEILFWFLIVPLLFVMILGTFEVKADYWLPIFNCGWKSFGLGILISMAAMSPALISVLFLPFCTNQERAVTAAPRAALVAGGFDAVLYLLLLGVFQWKFLAQLRYPVVSLMAVVQMPGDLFERQDALMTAIWFFCLFALFHSLCHYGALYLQKLRNHSAKTVGGGTRQVVIVMALVLIAGLVFLLNGCGKKEPEESMYPLAIGVQAVDKVSDAEAKSVMADGGARSVSTDGNELLDVFYAWPVPGGSDSSKSDVAAGDVFEKASAPTMFDAQTMVSENTDKTLDFNHLKVLALNVNILEDEEQMEQLLYYFKENENMAWNTCVIAMEEDVGELFTEEMASDSKSLGLYLEQMLRGRQDLKADATVTVKDLMSLYLNRAETILIPQLSTASGKPQIDGYRIYARRTDHGVVSPEEASYGYLLLNLAKSIQFSLPDGNYVTVQDLRLEREFTDADREKLTQRVKVFGTVKMSASTSVSVAKQDEILSEATNTLREELTRLVRSVREDHQADITGSFLVLPGYEREIWKLYQDNPDAYEKKLTTEIDVSLKMLNL